MPREGCLIHGHQTPKPSRGLSSSVKRSRVYTWWSGFPVSKRSSGRTSRLGNEIDATPALLTRLAEPLLANSF